MKIYHVITGLLRVNTYVLVNDDNDALVIDCGERLKSIIDAKNKYGFNVKAVLLTHAHFDHSGCAKALQDQGAKVYISTIDAPKLLNDDNLSSDFGRKFDYCKADYTFNDGDELDVLGFKLKVIATPGHTDGSVCFIMDRMLFTGDTLFLQSVGRTDFKTGDRDALVNSVKKLFALEGNYNVYPGHEDFTTLEHERKYNTFIDYD